MAQVVSDCVRWFNGMRCGRKMGWQKDGYGFIPSENVILRNFSAIRSEASVTETRHFNELLLDALLCVLMYLSILRPARNKTQMIIECFRWPSYIAPRPTPVSRETEFG